MKKLLLKLFLFFLVLAVAAVMINSPLDKSPHTISTFMAAMADKHKRLDSIPSPRILLVGGSNLVFGFDSQALQDSFSMPVVNMALNAGLGLSFILEEARQSIRSGDIVLLSCEYAMNVEGDARLQKTTSYFYPGAAHYYKHDFYDDFKVYLDYTHSRLLDLLAGEYVKHQQNDDTIPVYSRRAFNAYGDDVAHLDKAPEAELRDRGEFNSHYTPGLRLINEFCAAAASKNVKVYYLFPPYPSSEYKLDKEKIALLSAEMKRSLPADIPGVPQDFIYSDSLFYDTVYHLGRKGRTLRTARVIELLKQLHLPAGPAKQRTI